MNWGSFKTRVLNAIGDTSLDSLVHEWYNEIIGEADAETRWRSLERYKELQAKAPYSTGTVTVTNGSATVTGAGTTFPTDIAGQLFLGPDGRRYEVSTRDGATQLTLVGTYLGTTEAGGSYTLYYWKIAAPTDLSPSRIYALALQTGQGPNGRIRYVDEDQLFDVSPNPTSGSGYPYRYRYFEGAITFWPLQDIAYQIDCYYYAQPTELASATDSATDLATDWSQGMQQALLKGVQAIGFRFMDDTRYDTTYAEFQRRLAQEVEKNNDTPGGDLHLRSWREGDSPGLLNGKFPANINGTVY